MPREARSRGEDILANVSGELGELLSVVADLAASRRQEVWAVGGIVRDVLAGSSSRDVDLVVLGEVEPFAADLAARVGGEPRSYRRFLTVEFTAAGGFDIDIVRARAESYAAVAELPVVRPGTLIEDLRRRDFTINAMAVQLWPRRGAVVDPFAGRADLETRKLRVLHDRSFVDDPTRILRGLRLAHRLDFSIETRTGQLAARAVDQGALAALSRERLRAELVPLLASPAAVRALLEQLVDLGIIRSLFPTTAVDESTASRLAALDRGQETLGTSSGPMWLATLAAILWEASAAEVDAACDRLAIAGANRKRLVSLPGAIKRAGPALERLNSPYERYQLGESLGEFGRAIAICLGAPDISAFLAREWPELGQRLPQISGEDLLRMGFSPGARIGACLEETARACLEGRIRPGEELAFAARQLREMEDQEAVPRSDARVPAPAADDGDGSAS